MRRTDAICLIEKGEARIRECHCDDCIETRVLLGADTEREWRIVIQRVLSEEDD